METTEKWLDYGLGLAKEFGPKLLTAILIYLLGSWAIRRIIRTARAMMARSTYEESLQRFLLDMLHWGLKLFLAILVISRLGVDVTTFAAVIAAAGLAVGMALQGSLANFAGGVLIMIFRPYRIGDIIEAQDILGEVKEIEIFTTKLLTEQHKLAIVPNGILANGNIINYSAEGKIRVDLQIGVAYEADIRLCKELLLKVLKENPKVLQDPPPTVNVLELGEYSVNLAVRPFCRPLDYWEVHFEVMEASKSALDAAGIEIPYPHSVEIEKAGRDPSPIKTQIPV